MGDSKAVYSTRSKDEGNVIRRLLQRHGIPVVSSPRLLGSLLPGSRFDEVAVMVDSSQEQKARELITALDAEIGAHLARVESKYSVLESRLSYIFRDRTLLEQALTHRSRAREDNVGVAEDNESLEFLGDAVLGVVIADRLYRDCPDYDEGQKSKLKAQLVSSATLSEIGGSLSLGHYLLLGRGEAKSGGRSKPSLLANAVEAVIAAVYLDGGYEAAKKTIVHLFSGQLVRLRRGGAAVIGNEDFKSLLQEWLQAKGKPLPRYHLADTRGPDHNKIFTIELQLDKNILAVGEGRNKKEAEQYAAKKALSALRGD